MLTKSHVDLDVQDFVAHRTRSKVRALQNAEIMKAVNKAGCAPELSYHALEALLTARALTSEGDTEAPEKELSDLDTILNDDPLTYDTAMASVDADRWKKSMVEEWNSILENRTFKAFVEGVDVGPAGGVLSSPVTPISPPATARPISSKWVYKTKRNPDGSIRYKSRLVISGFQQVAGVDYGETYAPVSKLTSFRLLVSLAAYYGWKIDHLDVVTAFLNPALDRDNVYMRLPPGMEWLDPRFSPMGVVLLLKALYGLKQAPRLWYEDINRFLLSIGLQQSSTDPNLYIGAGILLLLYVDDIILAHTTPGAGSLVKRQLLERYKMSDLGEARRFLGLEIHQTPAGISLGQQEYILKVLRRFGMENCHNAPSPMDPNVRLNNTKCEDRQVPNQHGYLSIVGSLMYAALGTRPDLSYCVTPLSRYNATPLQMHLTAAKRALRYLKGTSDYMLHYPSHHASHDTLNTVEIHWFTDSDWAGNELTRKSVGGCIFFAGD